MKASRMETSLRINTQLDHTTKLSNLLMNSTSVKVTPALSTSMLKRLRSTTSTMSTSIPTENALIRPPKIAPMTTTTITATMKSVLMIAIVMMNAIMNAQMIAA